MLIYLVKGDPMTEPINSVVEAFDKASAAIDTLRQSLFAITEANPEFTPMAVHSVD